MTDACLALRPVPSPRSDCLKASHACSALQRSSLLLVSSRTERVLRGLGASGKVAMQLSRAQTDTCTGAERARTGARRAVHNAGSALTEPHGKVTASRRAAAGLPAALPTPLRSHAFRLRVSWRAPVRSDAEIQRERDEETARKIADLHWLDEGYTFAKRIGAKGILIDWQADPNFNNEQHLTNPHDWDAFPDYVDALRSETMNFGGQVVLVHGDSHYFKIDKPINLPSGGVLANFTRLETFGARQTHWVSATIDPSDPNLFEFEPRIVPANVG